MRVYLNTLFIFYCCSTFLPVFSQTNFREGWEAANPIDKQSTVSFEEKIKTHQEFLEKATLANDVLKQLYGQLYLAYDHLNNQDYTNAMESLLKAEAIANQANDAGWQGWIVHRKAIISSRLNNKEEAIRLYLLAAGLCGKAGDSLCVAESLEQVSSVYGQVDDFENALRYHVIAMPLIEKYGGEAQLGAALNNFGIANSRQGRSWEAIPYFERSAAIYQKLGKHKEQAKSLNNLADAYRRLKRYNLASELYQRCIKINKEHQIAENLVINYSGLQTMASEMNDYKSAYENLGLYFTLKDSLAGAEVQRKVAELQIKYDTQHKELELGKSLLALEAAQRSAERRMAVIVFGILLAGFGLWRWRLQTRQTKLELEKNRKSLAELTRILMEKNKQLAGQREISFEEELPNHGSALLPASHYKEESAEDLEVNIFDHHILTEADWASFKIYFENAYPGFLRRLRNTHASITDAEERLFIFIKLNLSTKESADILGISPASVKKTRNRLRRRLGLEEDVNLEEFVHKF